MRDREPGPLTTRQVRVMRAMSHTYELAADIGRRAEVDNRAVGAVLKSLQNRGIVERRVERERASMQSDRLYSWRLKP